MDVNQTNRTEVKTLLQLDAKDIIALVREKYPEYFENRIVSVHVSVTVPGGAGWSNTSLRIGDDATVDVYIDRVLE